MPVKWTSENDQLLLLKILETSSVNADVKAISAAWPAGLPGDTPTPRAITERLVKIRAQCKANNGAHFSVSSAQAKGTGAPRQRRPAARPNGNANGATNGASNGTANGVTDCHTNGIVNGATNPVTPRKPRAAADNGSGASTGKRKRSTAAKTKTESEDELEASVNAVINGSGSSSVAIKAEEDGSPGSADGAGADDDDSPTKRVKAMDLGGDGDVFGRFNFDLPHGVGAAPAQVAYDDADVA